MSGYQQDAALGHQGAVHHGPAAQSVDSMSKGDMAFCIRKLLTTIREHGGEAERWEILKMWNILIPSVSAVILVFLGIIEAGARLF
jgi:hypothetical protein